MSSHDNGEVFKGVGQLIMLGVSEWTSRSYLSCFCVSRQYFVEVLKTQLKLLSIYSLVFRLRLQLTCLDAGNLVRKISFTLKSLPKLSFQDNAMHFIRSLNERNFMVALELNSIPNAPPHQHNNFIVLDLACENAKTLLEQVSDLKKCS